MQAISVRVSGGLFLLLQAALLQIFWAFNAQITSIFTISIVLSSLTVLTILAAVGFFLLQYFGWLLAMVVQSLCLSLALILYFYQISLAVYATMIYSIFMVLYLNSFFIQSAFRTQQSGTYDQENQ